MASLLNKLFSQRYLIVTNTASGAIFLTLADAIQQRIECYVRKEPYKHDMRRTGSMCVGGMVFGLLGHGWYKFLDRRWPGKSRQAIFKKLGCEIMVGPPFALGVFLSVGLFEGKSLKRSFEDFKSNLIYVCAADWFFYTPLQFFNFYYLQPKYRFVYVAGITLIYDIFLSYLLHKDQNLRNNNQRKD